MLSAEHGGAGERLAVGLDVGGTKIAGGVVNAAGEVLAREQVPTPADGDATVAAMEQVVASLQRQDPAVATVGVGAAGLVDWPAGYIRSAPNNSYHALPPVVPARLGPEAGMVGAAALALSVLADGGLDGFPAAPAQVSGRGA